MEPLFQELLGRYFNESIDHIEAVPFGLTNHSRIIGVKGRKYVARIYNRHTKNEERLKFEIELTDYLLKCHLSFAVPRFLPSDQDEQYVVLTDGSLGSIVPFIEGEIPDLSSPSHVRSYGKTVGEISLAFQNFVLDHSSPTIKFLDLYHLHPLSNKKNIDEFLARPPFEIEAERVAVLQEYYQSIPNHAAALDLLPKQIVHHDLLIFNLLMDHSSGQMGGVLDFDFASCDIRVLELSICMNHLLQHDDRTLANVSLFLDEYRKYMILSYEEIQWIPYLMQRYYVSLLSIYIGQHVAGRDMGKYFHIIMNQLMDRRVWLERHTYEFIEFLKSKFQPV